MDLDRVDPRFDRIVAADASLDQIAHGTYFGEGPVWDRRKKRFLWVREAASHATLDRLREIRGKAGKARISLRSCGLRL